MKNSFIPASTARAEISESWRLTNAKHILVKRLFFFPHHDCTSKKKKNHAKAMSEIRMSYNYYSNESLEKKKSSSGLESVGLWERQRTSPGTFVIQEPLNPLVLAVLPVEMFHLTQQRKQQDQHTQLRKASIFTNTRSNEQEGCHVTQEERHCFTNSSLDCLHSTGYSKPTDAISVGFLSDSFSRHA